MVLTGGTAYLANAIAVASTGRGVLVALWTAALVCSGALIAPAIVATLRAQSLSAVLGVQRHWGWSICAVLAVDLVASGAMLADARRSAADPVAHPVRQGGGNPLSILPDPVQGVGNPTLTLSSDALPHSCPWGCGRRFATKDAAKRTRTALPDAGSAEGGGEGSRPQLRPGSGASRATSVDELEKWLAQRRRVSTCDPGPAE